jgi:hypothetical protein
MSYAQAVKNMDKIMNSNPSKEEFMKGIRKLAGARVYEWSKPKRGWQKQLSHREKMRKIKEEMKRLMNDKELRTFYSILD